MKTDKGKKCLINLLSMLDKERIRLILPPTDIHSHYGLSANLYEIEPYHYEVTVTFEQKPND